MVYCAKCGAELIGSQKFCAACGSPAGDPRSPAASTGQTPAASGKAPGSAPGSSGPSMQYAPAPTSNVNPFAQTAGPANTVRASDYGPPPASIPADLGTTTPGVGNPLSGPRVSPLAVSNALSQRGAFENAMTAGPEEAAAAAVGLFPAPSDGAQGSKRSAVPGTQLMPSMANPPSHGDAPAGATPAGGPPASIASKRPDRTQLLGAIPAGTFPRPGAPAPAPVPPSAPSSGVAAPAAGSAPSVSQQPVMQPVQPVIAQHPQQPLPPHFYPLPSQNPPAPFPQPVSAPVAPAPMPYAAPSYLPPPQPTAPPMQPQVQAAGGYVFGYVPGSRVTVTWSNGQRYPGTVQQVSGSQCLVVFLDGQHHWVDMQYVAPA